MGIAEMTNLFQPRLLNEVFGDPGLFVRFRWERRALLLDLGDLTTQPPADLLKVTDIFVSHTHVDHFIGFDHLLRIVFGRGHTIRLFGPPGFISNVEGKLFGYIWNLVEGYTLTFDVYEVSSDKIVAARFPCGARFERVDLPLSLPFTGVLVDDPLFRVEAVHLDHKIPCLAFALAEVERINIDPERLKRLGLATGPWLTEFKRMVRAGAPDDTIVRAPCGDETGETFRELLLSDLRDKIVTITSGQKLVYVTDTLYSDENRRKIVTLAQDADILFCEAMYLEQDRDCATERHHLTARQAGLLAREADVKELVIFHLSQRYQECPEALYHEAAEAFGGPVRSR
ncbi:MAG: ribonuclease Z [candidate division NC10 bacterium]|nr:ribonuclease Z [candidate division NC10 bacterium]MDE2484159.1 ribonuclease Z [candidate division NC10 bacterium]